MRCSFCGLNGIRSKDNDYKFMSAETAANIISGIKEAERWNPRLEFAMHGEPSVHPHLIDMLRQFRTKLPKRIGMMMTSNGTGFLKTPTETIDAAMKYLNVLALDDYENVKIVPKILERYKGEHTPIHYPANKEGNPHYRRAPNQRHLVIVASIDTATAGTHATLNNHCGAGAPKNGTAAGKRCAKPFREMSIRWDGSVALCCNDWRGVYKCGNVNELSLEEIWHSKAFYAARRKLYQGERDFGACDGCDATSYRPGLLPDHKGLVDLELPTKHDAQVIKAACAGKSYTLPVLRPWEKLGN